MSGVYDNWERLVGATLRREQLRRSAQRSFSDLSLASSSSVNSRASSRRLSSFNLPDGKAFDNEQIPGAANYLKIFTFAELKSATTNFSRHRLVAEGAFGRVFKGWVDYKTYAPSMVGGGIAVAVKLFNPESEQDLKECQAEVEFLKKFCHPNIVKLLGYCLEDKKFLLVLEYMQKGSLENHLFRRSAEILSWEKRMKIVIGAARALAFLHTTEERVIHRDLKAASILLDGDYNAKLLSFGLIKLGPISDNLHESTRCMGTYGYDAPEYLATGHLYVKSDVYSFGVVLFEILSGLRVFDPNRPSRERNLLDWGAPFLRDKRRFRKMVDPKLEGQYLLTAALQTAELILKCLVPDPNDRPSMEQVLEALEQIGTLKMEPKDPKSNHN